MTEPPPPNLITIKEACELLKCKRSSLYNMMKQKGFPTRKIKGLGRRFVRSEIEAFLVRKSPA